MIVNSVSLQCGILLIMACYFYRLPFFIGDIFSLKNTLSDIYYSYNTFFWLNFLCCLFFCPILHLREARLLNFSVHFLISLVAYWSADLVSLSSKREQVDCM